MWAGLIREGDAVDLYYMAGRRYDPEIGRFVQRTIDPGVYDGGSTIADLDSAGYRQSEYVYDEGTDRPYAVMTGPTGVTLVRYFAQDDFGNVQGVFVDSVTATQKVSYGDWGLQQ